MSSGFSFMALILVAAILVAAVVVAVVVMATRSKGSQESKPPATRPGEGLSNFRKQADSHDEERRG